METEDQLRRRRQQEALARGLQRPQSFLPGESAGIPDFLRNQRGPFQLPGGLAGLQQPRQQPVTVNTGATTGLQPPASPVAQPPPRIAVSTQPGASITGGLTLPQPSTSIQPPRDTAGIEFQPPAPRTPSTGPSLEGLSGMDRNLRLRDALATADPESKVSARGDRIDIAPPEKTGRWKGLGQMALLGLGQGDPDRPLYSLGQSIGGAITGAISPRGAAKATRRYERNQLDRDIMQGLKVEQEQAQLDQMRGPKSGQVSTRIVGEGEYPGIEAGTEIRVRVDPRTGEVVDIAGPNNRPVVSQSVQRAERAPHYEKDADGYLITVQGGRARRVTDESGKPVQVRGGKDGEEYVEVEVNGRKLRVTPSQALNYYGQVGERETKRDEAQAEREAKYGAAKSEYDSLVEAEKAAGEEKNRAYQVLDQMRAATPDDERGRQDIAQATKAAQDADAYYRTFAEKKADAARRMRENEGRAAASSGGSPPPPPGVTEASVRADAKSRGANEDEAVRKARQFGWIP